MRRALALSVVLLSGCRQATAPPAADASGPNPVKARKEMSALLSKADALTASISVPAAAATDPGRQPASSQPASSPNPVVAANPPAAPADSAQTTPAKSKADVMRDQAAVAFADRLRALRRTAEAARLKKDRYQQICQGKVVAQSECQTLTADVADASRTIEHELGDIQDAAQRARIDSDVMRDLLGKYGF